MTKPEVGHFRAQGVPLKRKLREFPVTEDALLPVGTSIGVRHFVPGQYLDVTGITKGKGFQVNYFLPLFSIGFLPIAFLFSFFHICNVLPNKINLLYFNANIFISQIKRPFFCKQDTF